ncbi:hypothetical protein [Ornithinimicrobium ciconiae]|uniref:hypothetical protein n=1 Tax=Ornithinimicrobium ciconiae TaxID=2594265 RepID=UPI001D1887B7|nr:hypothetical protein [Ornithinimicrobium ciconiae]
MLTVAAGKPPISTVGTPGGPMTPGCPVGSLTLAAGGMVAISSGMSCGRGRWRACVALVLAPSAAWF